MEHLPLRQEEESTCESPVIKGKSCVSSRIVKQRTFLAAIIIILVLVALVIVLGALYGAERAERKGTTLLNLSV